MQKECVLIKNLYAEGEKNGIRKKIEHCDSVL